MELGALRTPAEVAHRANLVTCTEGAVETPNRCPKDPGVARKLLTVPYL